MDRVATAWFDSNPPDMFQTFDQIEHGGRRGGFRHLPQPSEPAQAGIFPTLRERIEPAPLLGRQARGQAPMRLSSGHDTKFRAEAFDGGGRGNNNFALPTRLDRQRSQMGEPIIFEGLRQ